MLEDVLSVVIEYVGSLNELNPTRAGARRPRLSVVEGAECRRVSRTWCGVVDAVIERNLPAMPSDSLAALLAPGKLKCALLSCRYVRDDEHHQQGTIFASYNNLVSRAESCALHLRDVAMSATLRGREVGRSHSRVSGAEFSSSRSSSSSICSGGSSSATNSAIICRRVALKRSVGQVLASSAFSWCSTLGPEASCLLEGCVGASCLLDARWFSG